MKEEEKQKDREKRGKEKKKKEEGKEEGKESKFDENMKRMLELMQKNSSEKILVDGNMALSKYFISKRNLNKSLESLNKILVSCPWYFPASLEKVRIFSSQEKWDQCDEILTSILSNDSQQIEAATYKLFVDCMIDSKIDIAQSLKDLELLYDKREPNNSLLYYNVYNYII